MNIFVIAENDNSSLKQATLNVVAAAKAIVGDIDVLVAGENCGAVVEAAAKAEGVNKVLVADNAAYGHFLGENLDELVAVVVKGYSHILAAAGTVGKDFMPRVAALLDVAKDAGLPQFVNEELAKSDRPDLASAGIVVSGGRGMQNGENFKMLEQVADLMGAAVGASRAAVDAGFVPNDMQVGQTRKIVAPQLYIAVGISGAIQHLAGMSDSKVIVEINKDEETPISQVADYGLVADLFEAVPELEKLAEVSELMLSGPLAPFTGGLFQCQDSEA
jgi:electron transfer flavoprotein alpha subunit